MGFNSEREMKEYVAKRLLTDVKNIFTATESRILEEVPYSVGRTDLVVVNFSSKYLTRRIDNLGIDKSINRDFYLQLYLRIRDLKETSIEDLLKQFRTDKYKLISGIRWLSDHGFIDFKDETTVRSNNFRLHVTAVCAFELKLSDWKTALTQATQAKSYSNLQFVVLDDDNIRPALKNKSSFIQRNVGLISISSGSKCKFYVYPKKRIPYSPMGIWRLNEYTFSHLLRNSMQNSMS